MKHIVSFSGGMGSYMAAKRVVEQYGADNTLLVFTDTKTEDEDLYRFVNDTVADLGAELVYLADGRNVWDVFFDKGYMGAMQFAYCTQILKQKVFREWLEQHYQPHECIVYLGIDWSEEHRFQRAIKHWLPYTVKAPMCDEPFLSKGDMFETLGGRGIELPRLYKLGFEHNNCGGFCVKAGHGHFKNLLEKMPERYAYHEAKEQQFRDHFQKDVAILRDRKAGTTKPLTLKDFRERIESQEPAQQLTLELDDIGGCGCYPY